MNTKIEKVFTNYRFYDTIKIANLQKKHWETYTMAKEKRFIKTYSQDLGSTMIWVDKETGINYLFLSSGYAGGLTVLLDKDGKPIITPIEEE